MENVKTEYGTTRNKRRKLSSNTKENASLCNRTEESIFANRFTMKMDENINTPEESLKSISPIYDTDKKCEDNVPNTYALDSNTKHRKSKQFNCLVDNFRKSKSPKQIYNELIPNLNIMSIKNTKPTIFDTEASQAENKYEDLDLSIDTMHSETVSGTNVPNQKLFWKWATEEKDDKFLTESSLDSKPIIQNLNRLKRNGNKPDVKSPTDTQHSEPDEISSKDSEISYDARPKDVKRRMSTKKHHKYPTEVTPNLSEHSFDIYNNILDNDMEEPHLKNSKNKQNYKAYENETELEDSTSLYYHIKGPYLKKSNQKHKMVDDEIEGSEKIDNHKKISQLKSVKQSLKTVSAYENNSESEYSTADTDDHAKKALIKRRNNKKCKNVASNESDLSEIMDGRKNKPQLKNGKPSYKIEAYENGPEFDGSESIENLKKKPLLKNKTKKLKTVSSCQSDLSENSQTIEDSKEKTKLKNGKPSYKIEAYENGSESDCSETIENCKKKPQLKNKTKKLKVASCESDVAENSQTIEDPKKKTKLKKGRQSRKTVAAYENVESDDSNTTDNHSIKSLLTFYKQKYEELVNQNETQPEGTEEFNTKNNQKKSRLRSGSKQKVADIEKEAQCNYESSDDFTESVGKPRISQELSGTSLQDDRMSTRSMYRNSQSNEKINQLKGSPKSSAQKSKVNNQKENKRATAKLDEEAQRIKSKNQKIKSRLSHLNMSDDLGLSWNASCTPPRRISLRLLEKGLTRTFNSEIGTPRSNISTSSSFAFTPTPSKSKMNQFLSGSAKETGSESDQTDSDECDSNSKLKKKIRKSTNSTPLQRKLEMEVFDYDSSDSSEESTPEKPSRKGSTQKTPRDSPPTQTTRSRKKSTL